MGPQRLVVQKLRSENPTTRSLSHLMGSTLSFQEESWSRQAYLHTDLDRAERLHDQLENQRLVALVPQGGLAPLRLSGRTTVGSTRSWATWQEHRGLATYWTQLQAQTMSHWPHY